MFESATSDVRPINNVSEEEEKPHSLWSDAASRLAKDRWALFSIVIIAFYTLIALLTAFGVLAPNWAEEVGPSYAPPSSDFLFGTDIFGRSVFAKVLHGTQVAMSVGLVSVMISVPIGVTLGLMSGYFGGKVDEAIIWLYTTVSSIPNIMLLISIAFIMGKGLLAVYMSLGLTTWVTLCRLIRGEVIRHKDREYVQAAGAIGGRDFRKIFLHILPNITHIIIINSSLLFQIAIKSEVILSYLGLGVQGTPSWGVMIDDAKLELARGVWWQLGSATVAMLIVVLAFNILGDSLRDALDPKLKGK